MPWRAFGARTAEESSDPECYAAINAKFFRRPSWRQGPGVMEDLGPVNRVQLERVPNDLDAETEEVESGRARAGRLAPGVLQAFAGAWSQPQLANRRFFCSANAMYKSLQAAAAPSA